MKLRTLALFASFALALAACELETGTPDSGFFVPDTGNTVTDTGTGTDTGGGVLQCNHWAGIGTCQTSSVCTGSQAPDSICGGGETCCFVGALPSCEVSDGTQGTCDYTSACGAGFRSERGTCTGPDNVGCCVPDPEVEDCVADGVEGVCIDVAECDAVSTPGLCGGGENIQCCTEPITCDVDGVAGVCIDTELCDDERVSTPGHCPGAANIQCCHDPVSTGPCGENFFACDNGECVPKSDICDYKNDCGDYSDEFGCETSGGEDCTSDQLRCPEMCINASKACNGTVECADSYDEADCDEE